MPVITHAGKTYDIPEVDLPQYLANVFSTNDIVFVRNTVDGKDTHYFGRVSAGGNGYYTVYDGKSERSYSANRLTRIAGAAETAFTDRDWQAIAKIVGSVAPSSVGGIIKVDIMDLYIKTKAVLTSRNLDYISTPDFTLK